MVSEFFAGMLLLLSYIYLCLYMGGNSLSYHAAKHRASEKAIRTFFDSLSFPLDNLYVKNRGSNNLLTHGKSQDSVEYLKEAGELENLFSRLIGTTILLIITGAMLFKLTIPSDMGVKFVDIMLILAMIVSLIKAWGFGHKLKNIETSLREKTE
jgi:hypothetical protein